MNKRQRKKRDKKLKKKIFTGQIKQFTMKPDFKQGVDWTASGSVIDLMSHESCSIFDLSHPKNNPPDHSDSEVREQTPDVS